MLSDEQDPLHVVRACPFCGEAQQAHWASVTGVDVERCEDWRQALSAQPEWHVRCRRCGARGGKSRESAAAAVMLWNRRAP